MNTTQGLQPANTLLRKACKYVVRRANTYAVRRDCKYDADTAQSLQIYIGICYIRSAQTRPANMLQIRRRLDAQWTRIRRCERVYYFFRRVRRACLISQFLLDALDAVSNVSNRV